jgi:outer membrane protein OmpA-like peptidoglycan-associated protein
MKGHIQNQGCPLGDADGDGILDEVDKCPNTRGSIAKAGCPSATDEEREILELAIKNLYFDLDKDRIRPEAYPYLDRLAEVLVKRPELKIAMRGHADERGNEEYNLDLSKRRAEAALFYLMNRGVNRSQMGTEYFGERLPIGRTKESYQLDRRVEMEFIWD